MTKRKAAATAAPNTVSDARADALAAIKQAKGEAAQRAAAVEAAVSSCRTAKAKATYSALEAAQRDAVATGRLVIDRSMPEPTVLAIASLAERAASLFGQATGSSWGDDVNIAAAKAARSKRAAGAPRAVGSKANVEAMTALMAEYVADREAAGKRASVTPAAKWAQPIMKAKYGPGAFSWPLWQQLWGDTYSDVAVRARGDAMVAGVNYGGGDYRARVLVWGDGPDASEAGKAIAAAQRAYEAEREQRAAAAAKAAAADAKREQAKAKREQAKASRQHTPAKASTPAKCEGSGTMPKRIVSGKAEGTCGVCGQLVRTRKGVTIGHTPAKASA